MDTTPRIILITGLPGSGKSVASKSIIESLEQQGHTASFRTDREALEEEARRDTLRFLTVASRRLPKGGVEGDHSLLLNPDEEDSALQIVFKDGNALNSAHKQLLQEIIQFLEQKNEGEVFVIEWAYGKNVPYPNEELTHDGTQLISWLKEYELIDHVMVLDIVSCEKDRVERNSKRPRHIPTGEFMKYFPEEGLFTHDDILALGDRYVRIDNLGTSQETYNYFIEQIRSTYESFVVPMLEGYQPTGIEHSALHAKER